MHWHRGDDPHAVLAREAPATETLYERAVRLQRGNGSGPPPAPRTFHHAVTDHLGTVRELVAADGAGSGAAASSGPDWSVELGLWGETRRVRSAGSLAPQPSHDAAPEALTCPWRLPGQYENGGASRPSRTDPVDRDGGTLKEFVASRKFGRACSGAWGEWIATRVHSDLTPVYLNSINYGKVPTKGNHEPVGSVAWTRSSNLKRSNSPSRLFTTSVPPQRRPHPSAAACR